MATQTDIMLYARHWLYWSSDGSEAELRTALEDRFLSHASPTELANAGVQGGMEGSAHSEGCLLVILLWPVIWLWRVVSPPEPITPVMVEAAMEELRREGLLNQPNG